MELVVKCFVGLKLFCLIAHRMFQSVVNGVLSSSRPVVSGVPRGSVLGPVLFILFISDISCCVQSNLRLFADDCVLYREVVTHKDCLVFQQDLHRLFFWSKSWQLTFNVTKCYHASRDILQANTCQF